ncbi:MAG: hypothetical protein HC911_06865 [Chloroflexaceae bacterium]|nr:hypothetical protein [Chloroflexaceae bacterium]
MASSQAVPTLPLHQQHHSWHWARLPISGGPLLFLCAALLAVLLAGWQTVRLSQSQPIQQLDPADPATLVLLEGFHAAEYDQRGVYRWTAGDATIQLHPLARPATPILQLQLGPDATTRAPQSFALHIGEAPAIRVPFDPRPRRYQLALPAPALSNAPLVVRLQSDTTTVGNDPRPIGLRFEGLSLHTIGYRVVWASPLLLLVQAGLLFSAALTLRRIQLPIGISLAALVVIGGLLLLASEALRLLLLPYLTRLLLAALLLTLLTLVLLPPAERHLRLFAPVPLIRVLWAVALLACSVRLLGSLYPLFTAFDLGLNLGRLEKTIFGDLIVTSRSLEFRNRTTVYPPGPYLILMPALLLELTPKLLVQGGVALADGFTALSVGLLARAVGSSSRAAVLAAVLYAINPLNLTVLWFGLTAQIIGQAMMPPLAILMLLALTTPPADPHYRLRWVSVAVVLAASLLSHIGVAIIAAVWVCLVWLLAVLHRAADKRTLRDFAGAVGAAGVFGFVVLYSVVVLLKFEELLAVGELVTGEAGVDRDYHHLIWSSFRVAFTDWGLILLAAGSVLLGTRHRTPPQQAVLVGWVLTAALFLCIEWFTALQVRYLYFLVPVAYIAIATLFDQAVWRTRAGLVGAGTLIGWVGLYGLMIWYLGTFFDVMMDMTALVR